MTVIRIVKICILIAFISFSIACGSDNNDLVTQLTWEKTYGGFFPDEAYSVQQTSDGGYIITGYTRSFGAEGSAQDMYLIKTDANGSIQWEKTFGGPTHTDIAYSVQQTTDGGYILAGYVYYVPYRPPFVATHDMYLIKTDSYGNKQWEKTYDGLGKGEAHSVKQTTDGGYIIAGFTAIGYEDVYLIKTDSNGDLQWEETYGGSDSDRAYSVQQTSDGGYIIAGYTRSFGAGYTDVYLIKTDSNGNEQWEKTYGALKYDEAYSVQQTSDDGYILAGYTSSFGINCVYLIRTDSNGDLQWEETYGVSDSDRAYSVQQTTDGGYIIAGYTNSIGFSPGDVYLIKTDSYGNKQWEKTYGGSDSDRAYSVQQTSDGGYIIAGYTRSFGAGYEDVYLIKTDSYGNM